MEAGRLDVAQKLVDFGVQLSVFDGTLNTPLHLAVKLKVQVLLGCNLHISWKRLHLLSLLVGFFSS